MFLAMEQHKGDTKCKSFRPLVSNKVFLEDIK